MAEFIKVNVKANLASMATKSRFVDVKDGQTRIFRLLPPVAGSEGTIFYQVHQHWKLKDAEGGNIALANLGVHGTDETGRDDYIEKFSDALLTFKDGSTEHKIGKNIAANSRFYAQGFDGTLQQDNSVVYDQSLKLLSVPKTVSTEILEIIDEQEKFGDDTLDDIEGGDAVRISRTGTFRTTKYRVARHGKPVPLAEIVPEFANKALSDVYASLNLKIYTPEAQKIIAKLSYPNLDWDVLENEHGL